MKDVLIQTSLKLKKRQHAGKQIFIQAINGQCNQEGQFGDILLI